MPKSKVETAPELRTSGALGDIENTSGMLMLTVETELLYVQRPQERVRNRQAKEELKLCYK